MWEVLSHFPLYSRKKINQSYTHLDIIIAHMFLQNFCMKESCFKKMEIYEIFGRDQMGDDLKDQHRVANLCLID